MSPSVVTPLNFPQQLAMYMDAAGIGGMVIGLEDGKIVFGESQPSQTEPQKIIETDPRKDAARIFPMVGKGSSSGLSASYSRFMDEVGFVQGVADATVRRKDRKGNFRKDAEAAYGEVENLRAQSGGVPVSEDAARAFLESAFLYTSFRKREDHIQAKDLFVESAEIFFGLKRHTVSAILYELAETMLSPYMELTLERNRLHETAAEAWLASLGEYSEHDSARFRIFRALTHLSFMPNRKVSQELLGELANLDFKDDNFYEFYSNNLRRAHAIANDMEIEPFEWMDVKVALEGAAMVWDMLEETEGVGFNMVEPLMKLSRASAEFARGQKQFVM